MQNYKNDSQLNHEEEEFEDDFEEIEDDFEDIKEDDLGNLVLPTDTPSSPELRKIIKIEKQLSKAEKEEIERRKLKFERGKQLKSIISLGHVEFDLLDLPPKSEFELNRQKLGNFNQVSTQIPAVNQRTETEIQTIPIEYTDDVTQAPEDIALYSKATQHTFTSKSTLKDILSFNTIALYKFLQNSTRVCELLIQENQKRMSDSIAGEKVSGKSFSSSFTKFEYFLCSGRVAKEIIFCAEDPRTFLVNYSGEYTTNFQEKGFLCTWHMSTPQSPSRILVCNSVINTCCFGPGGSNFVFGGTQDGSVQLWDLREPNSMHKEIEYKRGTVVETVTVRYPTYSTDILINDNHKAEIVKMHVLGYNSSQITLQKDEGFQIATLDNAGVLAFWVVVSVPEEMSETDFGLSIGGRMKLVKNGEISVSIEKPLKFFEDELTTQSRMTFTFECEPNNMTQFLIGVDSGDIVRVNRFSRQVKPDKYMLLRKNSANCIPTVIQYSPYIPKFYLAGYSDGSIGLFNENYDYALYRYEDFTSYSIIDVRWSFARPFEFYVLDSNSTLFIFSFFSKENWKPKLKEDMRISLPLISNISAKSFSIPWFKEESKDLPLGIGYENGRVDIHLLK